MLSHLQNFTGNLISKLKKNNPTFNILNKTNIKQEGFHWSEKLYILKKTGQMFFFSHPSGFIAGPENNYCKEYQMAL